MNREITETEKDEVRMNNVRSVIDRHYWGCGEDCETAEEVLDRIINIAFGDRPGGVLDGLLRL